MDDKRLGPIAGFIAVALFVVSTADDFFFPHVPAASAPGTDWAEYVGDNHWSKLLAQFAWGIGCIALIWFFEAVRASVARGSQFLANAAFGTGVAVAALLALVQAPGVGAQGWSGSLQADRNLTGGGAEVIEALGQGFFAATAVMLGGVFLAVGLAAVQTRILPRPLGWVSLGLAVVAVAPGMGWAALLFGFPLWIIAVSVLLRRARATSDDVAAFGAAST